MKPILALTDFSPISLNAVNYAVDMACAVNTNLSLLHICHFPMTYTDLSSSPKTISELIRVAKGKMVKLESELKRRSEEKIKIDTNVVSGYLITETQNYCHIKKPLAVVMGSQGTSAVESFFLGNNTISLIQHLCWPLIIVPPQGKFMGIRKVGLACDPDNMDGTIPFAEVRLLVKKFNAELHILHVRAKVDAKYTKEAIVESRAVQNVLGDLSPVYHFIEDDDLEVALSDFVETNKLDLLIVVPKKHCLIDRLFHDSLSKRLILHSHVPVMAFHE